MGLRLFDHPLSPYSQKIKIALREKGVTFEACLPTGLGSGEQNDGLGAANPRGEVPALVLETGEALFESTVLLEFIEERWPEPPLAPPSALGRARARMIEEAMDTHYEAINWAHIEFVDNQEALDTAFPVVFVMNGWHNRIPLILRFPKRYDMPYILAILRQLCHFK